MKYVYLSPSTGNADTGSWFCILLRSCGNFGDHLLPHDVLLRLAGRATGTFANQLA